MDWRVSNEDSDPEPESESRPRREPHGTDIDLSLQNQSLTLLALMAAHPMPHRALQRFRDLVEAWRREPTEASLIRVLQAPAGRFAMNIDQVVQLLIPPKPATAPVTTHGSPGAASRRIERRCVPRPGQVAWPPVGEERHDVWRAADTHQQMHDLFMMALLSTHTEPRRISGQFRALLERLARSAGDSALDATSLVAVRRSAMRFDRILQLVALVADAPPPVDPVPAGPEPRASGGPRAAARAARPRVRAQTAAASTDQPRIDTTEAP
jgi:hypothetical protein